MIACLSLMVSNNLQAEEKGAAQMKKEILVTQSWDDGHMSDMRLTAMLRKYNAKATFFLYTVNYELLSKDPAAAKKIDPYLTPFDKLKETYKGFEVGGHSHTHADLLKCSPAQLDKEIVYSKKLLEQWFDCKINGFAYPYGAYNPQVEEAVKKAGYLYARVGAQAKQIFPPKTPFELMTTVYFKDPKFWDEFERVQKEGGVFYFWGHSHDLGSEEQWRQLEEKIAKISACPNVRWVTNMELFKPRISE